MHDDEQSLPPKVLSVIEHADEFVLYSLEPLSEAKVSSKNGPLKQRPENELFHGEGIVGQVVLKETKDQNRIVTALKHAIEQAGPDAAGCFWPHHGIRARKGKETIDVVICFTCNRVQIHTGDGLIQLHVSDRYPLGREFDVVLTRLGVPLEPKEK
jgi:hypothetical protein